MALKKSSGTIPEGSVALSEEAALSYQWTIVTSWERTSEIWPLRYGMSISAISASLTSMYINGIYRTALKLGRHGKLVSMLPTVVIPAIAASVYHQQQVLTDVLIMKSECPLCVQIRSAAVQGFFGGLYPSILAPLAGFMLATRHYTYDVPSIVESPKETFKFWLKLNRRFQGILLAVVCGQALLGSGLAYLQIRSILNVNEKMSVEGHSIADFSKKEERILFR